MGRLECGSRREAGGSSCLVLLGERVFPLWLQPHQPGPSLSGCQAALTVVPEPSGHMSGNQGDMGEGTRCAAVGEGSRKGQEGNVAAGGGRKVRLYVGMVLGSIS